MSNPQWNNLATNPMGQQHQQNNFYYPAPHYEVIQVNGENGVDMFQMGPNSSVLLLDKTAPIIWFVQTDGAGYKVKTPYDFTPHTITPPVDLQQLESRIAQLEELVNANAKSYSKPAKSKKSRADAPEQSANSAD